MTESPRTPASQPSFLKLRDDLVFRRKPLGGQQAVLVEDPITSKYFSLGTAEFEFAILLDGSTSIGAILERWQLEERAVELSEQQATALCRWLLTNELAEVIGPQSPVEKPKTVRSRQANARRRGANPLFIRVPLGVPDKLLHKLHAWFGWLHSAPAALIALGLACWALWIVYSRWPAVVASAKDVFGPEQRLGVLLAWLGLKLCHELSHGIACKKYQGYVREVGVLFILFAPIPYVDVTSSWRFQSKWQRIHTALAGVYLELVVASLALIGWTCLDEGFWNQVCINLVVAGSLTTLLLNANPLMRFDGYYVLSDLLDVPNLYSEGQLYVRNLLTRVFWGIRREPTAQLRLHPVLIRCYGIAAHCWRLAVFFGLCIAAAMLFHGAGLVLAVAALLIWIGPGVTKVLRNLIDPTSACHSARLRFVGTVCLLLVGGVLISEMRWPGKLQAPAIIDFSQLAYVRAHSPGFATEVRVRDGQYVRQGDVLVVLENRELEFDCASARLDVSRSRLLCRELQQERKMAEFQAEHLECEALLQRQAQLSKELDRLVIRAPLDGRVIARGLDSRLGAYLAKGDTICLVAAESRKEVQLSIGQGDVRAFASRVGEAVSVRTETVEMPGRLVEIKPTASRKPPHEAMVATNDGPLAVRRRTLRDGDASEGEAIELLAPRFEGRVEVPESMTSVLPCGRRCTVSIRQTDSVGTVLYRWVRDWVNRRLGKATP